VLDPSAQLERQRDGLHCRMQQVDSCQAARLQVLMLALGGPSCAFGLCPRHCDRAGRWMGGMEELLNACCGWLYLDGEAAAGGAAHVARSEGCGVSAVGWQAPPFEHAASARSLLQRFDLGRPHPQPPSPSPPERPRRPTPLMAVGMAAAILAQGGAGRFAGAVAPRQLRVIDTSASHEKNEDEHSDNVLSDNYDERWISGRPAPQHIDLDLGSSQYIQHVDLQPHQCPSPAPTKHRIYVGDSPEDMRLVHEVAAETKHHEWMHGELLAACMRRAGAHAAHIGGDEQPPSHGKPISRSPAQPAGVPVGQQGRFVRVETVEHPGWVAWSGIKLFGAPANGNA
jgi:hypothetical protein